jgi:hypothetical protein
MDRDPSANIVDAEDRTTPSTGQSPYGEAGDERARKAEEFGDDPSHENEADSGDEGAGGQRPEPGAGALSTPLPPD